MGPRVASIRVGLTLALTLLQSVRISAQPARGQITENNTKTAISGALVQLVAVDSTVLNSAISGSDGRFAFQSKECGPRDGFISVTRLGYKAFRAALKDLPLDCSSWLIALDPEALPLPELQIATTRNRHLESVGFYSRRRIGMGTFVTRDQLATQYATFTDIADVIRRIPGVFRVDGTSNASTVFLRAAANLAGACPAAIYVDGMFQQRELLRLPTQDVEAIEIYRGPAQVPAQYGGANASCGVIVIWTRVGQDQ